MEAKFILSQLGLENLSLDDQSAILGTLEGEIYGRIIDHCVDSLGGGAKTKLEELIGTNSPEAVISFLKENVPNFEETIKTISKEVVKNYKKEKVA
ncbi:MAG: hypothetical protein HQ402_03385 [Parcubacteria group bacterium]|nr:hypothetical protein [Parcubacteria group bacterium]